MSRREEIAGLHAQGWSGRQIAARLGVTPPTVCYHLRKLGIQAQDSRHRYDWPAIQAYYDAGHSVRECIAHFGFSSQTWHAATRRGAVKARPVAMPIDVLLSAPRNRNHIKRRLYALGLKQPRCERCGLDAWLDEPLSLSLHHINGLRDDNRLENLQILCPNCHSQTENFAGRNRPAAS